MRRILLLFGMVLCWISSTAQLPELIYYQFDDGTSSATNYASSPVGTNPAPITGSLTTASGGLFSSNALSGNGQSSTGNVVNTGWNTSITGSFTLAFWTSNVPSSSTLYYIFGDAGASSFRCFTNGAAGANNWMVRGGGLPDLTITGAATMSPNMIHVVYDATAGTYTGYVDGVQNVQVTASTSVNVTGSGLTIGGYATNSGLNGLMDEFRWYNRALSTTEIQNTYNINLNFSGNCANTFTAFSIDSVTATGAKFNWVPGTGNNSFYLEYGPTGFTPGSAAGTLITGTYPGAQPPVIISGLTPQTGYDVYVGEICNSGADSVYYPFPQQFSTTKACTAPDSLAVSNVTISSVDVSWATLGVPNSFNIIYGPSGFNPNTGGTVQNVSSSPASISSLTSNTSYDVYLYADCGTDGLSDTIGPVAFKTPCTSLSPITLPFFEGFESYSTQSSTVSIATDDTNFACTNTYIWNYDRTGPNGALHWQWDAHTGSQSAGLSVVASGTAYTNYVTLTLNMNNYTSFSGNILLSFWYRENSDETSPDDKVWVRGSDTDPWIEILDWNSFTDGNNWTYGEFVIDTTLTANGQSLSSSTQIRWGQNDNSIWTGGDGFAFDDVRVEAVNCLPVNNFSAFNITSTSASISFNGTGGNYSYQFGPCGFTQGTGTTGTGTEPFSLTGLSPYTCYDVYVQGDCGPNGLSPVRGPYSFVTKCAAKTAPYFDNFDTDPANVMPTCWSGVQQVASGTAAAIETYTFTTPNSAPNHIRMYNGSGTTANNDSVILVSPQFSDLTASDKRVRFFAKASTAGTELVVGTMADYDDAGSFVPLDTIVLTTTHTFYQVNIDAANGYNGTHTYVGFMHNLSSTFTTIYLDDFVYEIIPSCVGSLVTSLGVSGLGTNSATATWFGGQGDYTRIEWGSVGFNPGSGALGSALVAGTDSSYTITGLSPQTTYEYYIQDTCTASGMGAYVGPFAFTTTCLPVTAPYVENFDGPAWVPTTGTDPCWTTNPPAGSTWSWVPSSTAPTSGNGPLNDYTGGNFMYAEASISGTYPDAELISPPIDASALSIPAIYFVQHRYSGATIADMNVDVTGDFGATWTTVYTVSGDIQTSNSAPWQEEIIPLPAFVGDTIIVRFRQTFLGCCGDAAIDSFVVAEAPSCPDLVNLNVTAISDTGVTLNWTGNPNTSQYQIWFGPTGFYQGTQTLGGQKAVTSSGFYVLDTLSANTCYDFLVRGICSPGDTGSWIGPVNFCTFCTNQLAGTYTIGPTGDFTTFAAAGDELSDCGVSGPTVFNVQPGTYTDHMHMIDVPGVSSVNTVTINGGGASITYDLAGPQATILMDNASFITIDDLTVINNKSSEGWGIYLTGNSDSVSILNCTVVTDSSGNFGSDLGGIVVSGTGAPSYDNDQVYGAEVDYLTISGCDVIGGYIGISAYGFSTSQRNSSYTITNNNIRKYYLTGLYMSYLEDIVVTENVLRTTASVTDEDGFYLLSVWDYQVERNNIYVKDYGIYISAGNSGNITTTNSRIVNNMVISENDFGMYLSSCSQTDIYHNTSYGEPALYLISPTDLDIQNNIFVSDNDFAFESSVNLPSDVTVDYNVYYSQSTTPFDIGTPTYNSLAAWQAADATRNVNSYEGDPLFISPDDVHLIGGIANDNGNNSLGVTVDIDGDVRPASGASGVDIGADEYTPVPGDLGLLEGEFIKGLCLSTNDSIRLAIQNVIGSNVDFSNDPLTIHYNVAGPVNTSGSIVVNTGNLPSFDTMDVFQGNIDLSVPGMYTLTAYLDSNGVNYLRLNDTLLAVDLEVKQEFVASPQAVTLTSPTDSVKICVESSFFGGGEFFITEVMHFKTTTGAPTGGWPSWHNADEHIEITGVPGSDLGGITFEQWNTSGTTPSGSYTFPQGTVLGPNGTAVVAMRSVTPSPANYFYDGSGGNTTDWQSGGGQGVILRDAAGNIMDAVGYGSSTGAYTFPAAAGVTAADWTGATASASGTCGIRLIGPDMNDPTNWITSSAAQPQDPNVLNPGVSLPAAQVGAGLTWTLNGVTVDTTACIYVGPITTPGTYNYIATYSNTCGNYVDTVVVTVPGCFAPAGLSGTALSTSSAVITWDSTGMGTATYEIEYGSAGFTPGTGQGTTITTTATNTTTVTGLTTNLCADYYLRASCGTSGFSPWIGPVNVCPEEVPCDSMEVYAPGPLLGQSALFQGWYGTPAGAPVISTAQSVSGSQSMYIPGDGLSDVVAYYDTIDSGIWNVSFNIFVPSGTEAYYNFQRNYTHGDPTQTNVWAFDVNFLASGTASIDGGSYGGTGIASFSYNPGQWNSIEHIIDFDNDSILIVVNGVPTSASWQYSFGNFTVPVQNNGVDFYSNPNLTNPDYYVDDFCIEPYVAPVCMAPSNLATSGVTCDNVNVSWNSTNGNQSTILEYGPTGFTPGTGAGTVVNYVNSPYNISALSPGTGYDVYLMDTCGNGDTTAMSGPLSFTTSSGPLSAAFTKTPGSPTMTELNVSFNASTSAGASVYSWRFGDGSFGTGMVTSHDYTANGTYIVTLTITGVCGTDSVQDTVVIAGISLDENLLSRSLQLYPNPAKDQVHLSFSTGSSSEAVLSILDLSGKTVRSIRLQNLNGRFEDDLDISRLADGTYMLRIESSEGTAVRRIVKQ